MKFTPRKVLRKTASLISVMALATVSLIMIPTAQALPSTVTPAPNPQIGEQCGLNLALNLDLSNSITNDQYTLLKDASSSLVDTLTGTPTGMGVFNFASYAPTQIDTVAGRVVPPENTPLPTSDLSSAAGAQIVKDKVNNLVKPSQVASQATGGTNWDRGLAQTLNDGNPIYDAVIFITDGDPTVYADGNLGVGGGAFTDQQDIDEAVRSANAIKAVGTKVIVVSVNSQPSADSLENIVQVSGPNANDDYYTTSFNDLDSTLREIAERTCSVTVTAQKLVDENDGSGPQPAAEWDMTANWGQENLTQTTGADGKTSFTVGPIASNGLPLDLTETAQDGYQLRTQNGANAVCTLDATGESVNASNRGALGVSTTVAPSDDITCTFINERSMPNLSVTKSADPTSGSTVVAGQDVEYSIEFENTGNALATVDYTDDLSKVLDDADVTVQPVSDNDALTVTEIAGGKFTVMGELPAGESATITYTVKVKADGKRGDNLLANFVTPTGEEPPSECLPDNPLCTEHPIPPTVTPTPSPTETVPPSPTPTGTVTPSPTETVPPSPTPTTTPTGTVTPTPSSTTTEPGSPIPTDSGDPTPGPTPTEDLPVTGANGVMMGLSAGAIALVLGGVLFVVARRLQTENQAEHH